MNTVATFAGTSAPAKSSQAAFLTALRSVHRFLGIFTAPALLFFAFTGAVQTLSLHEPAKDGSYTPPAWIASLGQLHKKQTLHVDLKKLAPQADHSSGKSKVEKTAPKDDTPGSAAQGARKSKAGTTAMNGFFLVICVSLVVSTASGLQTAWKFSRNKPLVAGVAIGGALVPVLLLFL